MQTVVIDRFEGGFALCQSLNGNDIQSIALDRLPAGAKEGDILIIRNKNIEIDKQHTDQRKAAIRKKMDGLWD